MKIYIYTDDSQSQEYLSHVVRTKVSLREALEVQSLHNAIVMLAIDGDVEEELIHALIEQDNKLFILQRRPTLEHAKNYLALGVRGYGNTFMHEVYFKAALRSITSGMVWLHPSFTAELVATLIKTPKGDFAHHLTHREEEIAQLILEGKSNLEIAHALKITPRTVKAHTSHIYTKLEVKDRLEFALMYK